MISSKRETKLAALIYKPNKERWQAFRVLPPACFQHLSLIKQSLLALKAQINQYNIQKVLISEPVFSFSFC
jgi:hypothetical protein